MTVYNPIPVFFRRDNSETQNRGRRIIRDLELNNIPRGGREVKPKSLSKELRKKAVTPPM